MNKIRMTATNDWELAPLSPRSIVLSVLLGSHPPTMPVGRLLEFTSLFGIADGAVRTALSRLVRAGDLATSEGIYRLSPRLEERQRQQDLGRSRTTDPWDGTWWLAAVVADRRSVADRREFRAEVTGARLGELRPDLWIRPANIHLGLDRPDVLVTRGPLVAGPVDGLVEQLWDLDGLDHAGARLLAGLEVVGATLRGDVADDDLPAAFTTLATCQRFLRSEPQLPPSLSDRRSADVLRQRYDAVVADFQDALTAFFTRHSHSERRGFREGPSRQTHRSTGGTVSRGGR